MRQRLLRGAFLGCLSVAGVIVACKHSEAQRIQQPLAPSFSRDVAPIILENCVGCHRPDGSAPFSLLTYADARAHAGQIVAVTRSRVMPPWKPERGYGSFLGARGLTDAEITTIEEWVNAGAMDGDPAALASPPISTGEWRLGQPDLIVEMPEPFLLRPDGLDVFRTFVIPLPVDTTRYVTAFELNPGATRAVHHANLLFDPTTRSRSYDDTDPQPGYEGVTAFSAVMPDGYFLGWTPGQLTPAAPEEMSWPLQPGTDLALELHLRPTGRVESVQARVAFFFADRPPTQTPTLIRLSRQDIDIAAGATYTLEDTYVLPVDVELHTIQPHAHYVARTIEAFGILPDGTRKWLIYIRDWDFDWQDSYRYTEPVFLPRGTTLVMRYSYDNSGDNPRNPNRPPQRVRYGQKSTDEMAELYLQVVTPSQEDREALLTDYRPKEVREFIKGFEMMLDVDPNNAVLHSDLGSLYFEIGDAQKAIGHLAEALRIHPDSASAHNNLGVALQSLGQVDDALMHYEAALETQPDHPVSHFNIGVVHEMRGDLRQAAEHFERALSAETRWPSLLTKFAWILATSNDPALRDPTRAVRLAQEVVHLMGDQDAPSLDVLAAAYASASRFEEAIATAEAALAVSTEAETGVQIAARLDLYRQHLPYVIGTLTPARE